MTENKRSKSPKVDGLHLSQLQAQADFNPFGVYIFDRPLLTLYTGTCYLLEVKLQIDFSIL